MLLPRLLTMFVGIPLLAFLIHLGSLPFMALVIGVVLLALYEYALILWVGGRGVQRWMTVAAGGFLATVVILQAPRLDGLGTGALLPLSITGVVLAVCLRELLRKEHSLDRAALSLLGVFFIGWTLAHLALLRDLRPYGERFTFFLFLTVWVVDIAAYAAGHAVGSRRLAPVISPKKTWEGAVAGFAAAVLWSLLAHRWFLGGAFGLRTTLLLGAAIGLLSQASDLAQSLIKRTAGVKDSSSILPGHGGILDRFDSFLLTAPAMYYAVLLISP
ncbi:MAG: phosphatidate cytidylyltransferase [Elusimicrobia bacterium]|nr:phosphatidate cytidylyltransferase [Elusimicrobiota bacterium]